MACIALLFEYPTLNGGERSILASLGYLRGRFRFVAFAPPAGPLSNALEGLGIEICPSPLIDGSGRKRCLPEAVAALSERVRRYGIDLVHGNSLAVGRFTGAVAPRLSIPCTAHLRDIIRLSASAVADLNGNTRLVAVSEATRDFHLRQGVDERKTVTVYNGVDLNRFRPHTTREQIRNALHIPHEGFVALTVGQVGLRKGWDVFAEAATSLAKRFPNLHVLLAGERYSEKPETIAYERAVRSRFDEAMPGRAYFIGYRDDMPELMNAADLLVHPARQEPFGRVLLEAAACGLPIVASNVGGTAELLRDGMSARLVPAGNPKTLGDAVGELLVRDDLRERFAVTARKCVEEGFAADSAAERLADLWGMALSQAASPP